MEHYKETLTALFGSYVPLSAASKKLLLDNINFVSYEKNELIISEGKNDRNEYFLLEGICHRFNVSEEGKEVTTGIYYPSSVIVPHFARTLKSKSIFSLQALTSVVFGKLTAATFDTLRQNHPDIRAFGQMVVEKELSKNILNETIFRSYTAKQRLILVRNAYPNLENVVPHNIIASFLGVTPVSFSRLRNELASSR